MRVYIIADEKVMAGTIIEEGRMATTVRYVDLSGQSHDVRRANEAVFLSAREAGAALDAEATALDL